MCSAGATCSQANDQVNANAATQSGDGTNVAVVQQSNQNIQQIGVKNRP